MRTTMMLEQLDSKTQQTKKVPTIATAKDMHYEDELRRATYTTNAHVNGPQGDLRGVKIELYFVEGGGSLERVEAYDDVIIKTDERTTTGNAPDVLRRRRALPDDGHAGESRRELPRNYRQNVDLLQDRLIGSSSTATSRSARRRQAAAARAAQRSPDRSEWRRSARTT